MKRLIQLTAVVLLMIVVLAFSHDKPRILVFSKTGGFRHSSIPAAKSAIMKLGKENGFDVDTTEDSSRIVRKTLKKYAAVVFLQVTGDVLNTEQQKDFEHYIQAGGGYVGIHGASAAEPDWSWYGELVGARFDSHPAPQEATLNVVDHTHSSSRHLPSIWTRKDEWYNFKAISPKLNVLITIDEKSYTGGKNGNDHPMAWYHSYDGGRAWYTALGHADEAYAEENFLKHLLGGIEYAIGKDQNK
ncbi:ThuA domain-containing protein [Chitinophagaceae bacterium 26-R-25]|nr:ThuA domain-containing protein [Chitinophagaceae bacterium 26-R-25]